MPLLELFTWISILFLIGGLLAGTTWAITRPPL